MNIILAQSNLDLAALLKECLESSGHKTLLANSYNSFKKIVCTHPARLLILDQRIEGGKAEQIAEEAKSRGIRTILISTSKQPKVHCDTFIKAPFDLDVLEKAVNSDLVVDGERNVM